MLWSKWEKPQNSIERSDKMRKEKQEELDQKISSFQIQDLTPLQEQSHFLKVVPYNVKLKNGITFKRERLLKNNKDGSASITMAITEDDEVLFVIEPRVFTREGVGVGLPAGYAEKAEDMIEAALRELLEETGYLAGNIQVLGSFYQDEGCSGALNYGLLATKCKKIDTQHLDKDEHIEIFQCTIDEAYELLEKGYIKGANSQLTMLFAKPYLKR